MWVTVDSLIFYSDFGSCGLNQRIDIKKYKNIKIDILISVSEIEYQEDAYEIFSFTLNQYENYFIITSNKEDIIKHVKFNYMVIGRTNV